MTYTSYMYTCNMTSSCYVISALAAELLNRGFIMVINHVLFVYEVYVNHES